MARALSRDGGRGYMQKAPLAIDRVLRGAARAGGGVIRDEVKARAAADETRDNVVIRSKRDSDKIIVRITVKRGWGLTLGIWQEWGTSPHFISVDDSQRNGRSVARINQQVRESDGRASLVIGGKFVGRTVWHPGAKPESFMAASLDIKRAEAIATAQNHITTQLRRHGVDVPEAAEGDEP